MDNIKEILLKTYTFNSKQKSFLEQLEITEFNHDIVETINLLLTYKLDLPSVLAYISFALNKQIEDEEINKLKENLVLVNTLESHNFEEEGEALRRMIIAMSQDLRVIVIKLCLVLNEINAYKFPLSAQQKRNLQMVREIFAPLAERLGLNALKSSLEDLCLKNLEPEIYNDLQNSAMLKREENQKQINILSNIVSQILEELNIKGTITSRQKHYSSVYKKMKSKNITLAMIYDLVAMRIIVDTVEQCYTILGRIHELYKPMPDRFKDYIAVPKSNGYQSLHTTIIADNNRPLEIQIRTQEMHRYAEFGIAAHWMYKEKRTKQNSLDKKMSWVREMMNGSEELTNQEFIETLKVNLLSDTIFVQTPKGKVLEFPENSIIIDFAYLIHSDIGNSCVGAKVNGKIQPLTTKLKNGDIIEIITSVNAKGPSRDWLKYVKTPQARSKINSFFKRELKDENIKLGKQIFEQALKNKPIEVPKEFVKKDIINVCERYAFHNEDEMYAAIGYGSFPSAQAIAKIYHDYIKEQDVNKKYEKSESLVIQKNKDGVLIDGDSGMLVRYANCCSPSLGEDIVGYISRGRGVTIHTVNCHNVKYLESERIIEAKWAIKEKRKINSNIRIISKNRNGFLADITKLINDSGINLKKVECKENQIGILITNIGIETEGKDFVYKLIKDLNNMEGVSEVIKIS